jgi:hypothetical protein
VIGGELVMGLGAALIVPNSLAIAATAFHDAARRGRALGIWAACSGIGFAIGPLTSGLLLAAFSWHAVFVVNAVVAVIIVALAPFGVTETHGRSGTVDIAGSSIAAVAIAALVLGVVEGIRLGFGSPVPAVSTAVFVAGTVVFVIVERRVASPVVSFRAFRSRIDVGALLVAAVALFSFAGVALLATLEMQRAQALSALAAGVHLLALTTAFIVTSTLAAGAVRLAGRFAVIMIGLGATLAGTLTLWLADAASPLFASDAGLALIGAGLGLLIAPTTALVIDHAEAADASMTGAVVTTLRQIGAAFGGGALGVVVTNRAAVHQGHGLSPSVTFTLAEHDALAVLAVILGGTTVAAAFLLRPHLQCRPTRARDSAITPSHQDITS